ncbi:AAEL009523-PA [Aedes aegypti]|uniref:AAEL009523-PA n=1 Tax=Aedes aegypti TaxID=7159 RepID=Q16VL7_AEDAE|nr:AAEL009523-PA [Aedes aegypti]
MTTTFILYPELESKSAQERAYLLASWLGFQRRLASRGVDALVVLRRGSRIVVF